MKRVSQIILAILLLPLSLTACDKASQSGEFSERTSVVTTIFAPYDFVREITGDKAEITMLLPPAAESHSYEPSPRDIITIQNCDVFIYVGGESDAWVDEVLSSMDTANIRIITLMECVDAVEEEIVEGMELEHLSDEEYDDHDDHDDHDHIEEPEYDEHVWTSPKNAKLIAQKISDTICESDPSNCDEYRSNTEAFLIKLDELDAAFEGVMDKAVRDTVVFGDRFPFRYLSDEYGLNYFSAFPGCSTESEPSAQTLAFLIDKINDEDIPVVFYAELSNGKMADTISEATGAKPMLMHACHNISKEDFQNGVTYLDLMNQNVAALEEALQ